MVKEDNCPLFLLSERIQMNQYFTIKPEYYIEHPTLQKILDINHTEKHNFRIHLCLAVFYQENYILIPLRKNLGPAKRPFGIIGHAVPSQNKPYAGLDYRYMMVIKDAEYLQAEIPRLPHKQLKIMENHYSQIETEALNYIQGYIKTAKKGRIKRTPLYRESALINFHKELGLES